MNLRTIYSTSLLASAYAWGSNSEETEAKFDPNRSFKSIKTETFTANTFTGDSINFRGREIRNAALVDSTIDGIQHLNVDSLAVRSQAVKTKDGHGLALINSDGVVSSTGNLRWDETKKTLKVSSLEAFGRSISINSDIDLNNAFMKNAKLSPDTVLEELEFRNGLIENSVLRNVTATGLSLGDVTMDSIAVSEFNSKPFIGSILVVGEDGSIRTSSTLKQENEDLLVVNSEVLFTKPIDLNDKIMTNANIISGSINGKIDISADHLSAKSLTVKDIQDDKTITSDGLAIIGLDGTLQMSPIKIDKDGALGDINVKGEINCGRLANANIVGGSISDVESLSISGNADLGAGLHVAGEAFIDGSLTVSGSVLGSGPYVDVSDRRFKRNVETIESSDALDKILQLEGISYDLDFTEMLSLDLFNLTDLDIGKQRQLGFIAQEVEQVLPELVYNDEDLGWKGLHYSRLAPVLVESVKQLSYEIDQLKMTVSMLFQELNRTRA